MARILSIIICMFLSGSALWGQMTYTDYYQKGMTARDSGDTRGFLRNMQLADSLRPQHPAILFRLGSAYILNGNLSKGLECLKTSLLLNTSLPIETEEDLKGIRDSPGYAGLLDLRDSLNLPVVNSKVAFTLQEADLHVEGLARDTISGTWYFGSVHKRKIVKLDTNGDVSDFKHSGEEGLMAVMGMTIANGRLWVSSVPAKEMEDYDNRGEAAVLCFSLKNGALLNSFSVMDGKDHWFGDLVADKAGNIFFTDSFTNEIYIIEKNEMHLWMDVSQTAGNLQGIAADSGNIYFSDYLSGIYRIARHTREIKRLYNPFPGLMLKGTDGLELHDRSLIATINGQLPNKVIRLHFDPVEFKIEEFEVLDSNHPDFGEPTLGLIHNGLFYYVGNSPWGAYKNGDLPADDLPPVIILAAPLK